MSKLIKRYRAERDLMVGQIFAEIYNPETKKVIVSYQLERPAKAGTLYPDWGHAGLGTYLSATMILSDMIGPSAGLKRVYLDILKDTLAPKHRRGWIMTETEIERGTVELMGFDRIRFRCRRFLWKLRTWRLHHAKK